MTAFDLSLDQSQNAVAGAPRDAGEVAFVRHDIDRALGAVLAGLSGVAAADLDARTREFLDQAAVFARTLTGLVRVMRGEVIPVEEVVLETLLSRVRTAYAAEARARGIVLATIAEPGAPATIRVGRLALVRILDNLLDNALRYSSAGKVTLTVGRNAGDEVVFRVTDEGPGAGTGIEAPPQVDGPRGLDVVRALADRLGAAVSLGDRAGGGTEAVLRLPPSGAVAKAPARLSGARLLLAEDNLTNQMVALQMLRALGATVTICSDGIEALDRFDEGVFDLVVVDIEMPRMSGLDVIRAIRARGDSKARVPIVALTAYALREHRERIAAAGANGLISKPVTSVEALGESLAPHLRRGAPGHGADSGSAVAAAAAEGGDGHEPHEPVIDAATYAALCEAIGPELMAELLDKVIADLRAAQRDLVAGSGPVDRLAIRSASHILISVAGALGALRLQGHARALNASAHTEAEAALAGAVSECVAEIDLAVAFARERRGAL
jgi:two-component system, OmpR family, aerobic respiration control sensor histidine kinase ArcB